MKAKAALLVPLSGMALAAGVGLGVIGRLLGHRSMQTTHRYAHLVDEAVRDAVTLASGRLLEMMKGLKLINNG